MGLSSRQVAEFFFPPTLLDRLWVPPWLLSKRRYTPSVKLSDLLWRHTWWKKWVNWAVLTYNSAGLRTVFSSRLLHRKLRSSLRESHSFLSVHADTTMASSQGTQPSKMNKREANLAFIATYRSCFVFIHHSHTHKKKHKTAKKLTKLMGNLCYAREHSVRFIVQFFYTVKLHSLIVK